MDSRAAAIYILCYYYTSYK